ncbi:2-C-methyl-D-erythritol 4-phosphate cytidylyltransferase [candidate division KSB1 bacterium]|jgi:2-C-methyl-D-erythritol 4-phosphate cytidylyltransferase|nr:2-C-methyl-D-erythritol 4-phosphate cytidylyltransferase [candidate division KSB1 bacterium]
MQTLAKHAAIIVAAGKGKRMASPVRKQYLEISGRPILYWTLKRFQDFPDIKEIVLVVPENDLKTLYPMVTGQWQMTKVIKLVAGGKERHDSVYKGLRALSQDIELVLIHDGVRPFVSDAMLERVIEAAAEQKAAVVGVPPKDTIKRVEHNMITETLSREHLVQVQTPQVFRYDVIMQAFEYAFTHQRFSTDDTALVENIGISVKVVMGDYENIKITSKEDMLLAEQIHKRWVPK